MTANEALFVSGIASYRPVLKPEVDILSTSSGGGALCLKN